MSTHWMTTASGVRFYMLEPREEDVLIEDIAHALSHICRFGGHCREFYSVGQHSLHVARILEEAFPQRPMLWMGGLLHDAAEAYLGDMVRPLKMQMDAYRQAEANLEWVIEKRFALQLTREDRQAIRLADDKALMTERRDLVNHMGHDWEIKAEPDYYGLVPLRSVEVRSLFLARFARIREACEIEGGFQISSFQFSEGRAAL